MPSPVGHAMAGAAVALLATALTSERITGRARLVTACAASACAPDLDLLVANTHRIFTHSVTAVVFVTAAAMAVAVLSESKRPVTVGLLVGGAYGTHLVLDWLGEDMGPPAGIQAFWPWSSQWFVSGLDLFGGIHREHPFTWKAVHANALALIREVLLLGPILGLSIWIGRMTRSPKPAPRD